MATSGLFISEDHPLFTRFMEELTRHRENLRQTDFNTPVATKLPTAPSSEERDLKRFTDGIGGTRKLLEGIAALFRASPGAAEFTLEEIGVAAGLATGVARTYKRLLGRRSLTTGIEPFISRWDAARRCMLISMTPAMRDAALKLF
jgi:hypothetical protein